jgi:hypothetical protein
VPSSSCEKRFAAGSKRKANLVAHGPGVDIPAFDAFKSLHNFELS